MPVTTNDLYTTVKNTSGRKRFFGYLGDLGVDLEANEEYSERGHLIAKLQGRAKKRAWESLMNDLDLGVIDIKSTPINILRDETTEASKALVSNNGSVTLVDPQWGQLDSLGGGV